MRETWAILPIKDFEFAKTRLRPALTLSQCTSVARWMAVDMLRELTTVAALDGIVVIGGGPAQAGLARLYGCDYFNDDPALDISLNLTRIARLPQVGAADKLLYIPADLPQVTAADIGRLLARAGGGLTICRALRDGGTNAMVASPAEAMRFSLGDGSADRHARIARAAGIGADILDEIAFQRDIDVPHDLAWLCRYGRRNRTVEYLCESGLQADILALFPESIAS